MVFGRRRCPPSLHTDFCRRHLHGLVLISTPRRAGLLSPVVVATSRPPPPPLRGRRDRMRVPKISGKGVLFVRQSPAREKKKRLFTRRFLLKRGWVFFLSLFERLRNLNRGLNKIKNKIIIGGTLSSVLDLGGSPR